MFKKDHVMGKRFDSDKYPMISNLNADPRLIGNEALLCPFVQFNSSQRMNMFSNNVTQALLIDGCDFPAVSSAYEYEFLKYNFNTTRLDQDANILAVIPKYKTNVGSQPITSTPSYTVIYHGADDDMIHCLEVSKFVKGTDGFGYDMIINYDKLVPDIGIKKNEYIAHSKAVQGSRYCMGVNANVVYLTTKETVEDAFCISDEIADKMGSSGYKTLVINIDKNYHPLNLYGNVDEYKICPDIGERVREDCILCGFRKVNDSTVIADMPLESLMRPQYLHDDIYYAVSPDAEIVDIEVYENPTRKVKTQPMVFEQLQKYKDGAIAYHKKILETYTKFCVHNHKEPSPEFNTLVTRSGAMLAAYREKVFNITRKSAPRFSMKNEVISFIQLIITYKFKNKVTNGYKLTGREGGKGVVSKIMAKADMPVNDFGTVADIIMAPEAVFNRMNLSQLYEQFLNCMSEFVIKRMKRMYDEDRHGYAKAFDYLIEYITDINPEYAKAILNVVITERKKEAFVFNILKEEMIILVIPPFLDTLCPKWALMMTEKYKVEATPIEYNLRDENGKLIRRVRTIRPIWIGKKYLLVLCKIPHARSCGMSHVNQWGTPIRIKSPRSKSQYPVGLTPIRIGEDENRNIMMMAGANIAFRILSLYANTPEATEKLTESLLTEKYPTRLTWADVDDAELKNSNQMIAVAKHMLQTVGVDITDHIIHDDEKSFICDSDDDDSDEIPARRKRRTKKEMEAARRNLNMSLYNENDNVSLNNDTKTISEEFDL